MTHRELAEFVERELGQVPQAHLTAQQARWHEHVQHGDRRFHARSIPLALALAALVAGALVAVLLLPGAPPTPAPMGASPGATGAVHYDFVVPAGEAPRRLDLAPDEVLSIASGSSGSVHRGDPATTRVTLLGGTVALAVPTGTGRSWAVAAGPFLVEVLGTDFSVTWEPGTEHIAVAVHRGQVRVSGGSLTTARVLGPGEHLEVGTRAAPTSDASAPSASGSAEVPSPTDALPRWRALQQQRQYADALAAAESAGFDRLCASLSAAELSALADTARLAGSPARAQQALAAVRGRFPGTNEAATAAFLLGRQGGATQIGWLETYLAERPDGPFAQEALGRLMVSHRTSGDEGRARTRARQYLARYPGGAYAEHARAILGGEAPPAGSRE